MDHLDWLPQHSDLGGAIKAARAQKDPQARLASAIQLSRFRRDLVATERIDRLASDGLAELLSQQATQLGLTKLRLALLGSHSLGHLAPAIRVAGLQRKVALDVHVGDYGLFRHEIMEGNSALLEFAPHLILLAIDEFNVPLGFPSNIATNELETALDQRVDSLRHLWQRIRETFGAQPVQQTLVSPNEPLFGNYEGLVPGAPLAVIERFNAKVREAARKDGALLVDVAWEAARRGLTPIIVDPVRWHHAKQMISPLMAPLYGDLVARLAAAVAGLSRKCMVLDLDNTLWGGVVGDDGIEELRLGQGNAEGEAYSAFQRYIALLEQRGVILAICSKNNSAVAEAAFTTHLEMILKRDNIAAFVANWNDKASNLRAIAKTLSIGLDSMVFVDDNPAERDIIRRELPEVAVPELPDDVAFYPRCIANACYFETTSFTAEDTARGRSYAQNEARLAELEQSTDIEGYLRSLDMVMNIEDVEAANVTRAAQLINKTNQFNLTTRRYTQIQVERFTASPGNVGLCFRLKDRLGDNGLISVVLAKPLSDQAPEDMWIDTWVMSCRVLGRQVERAVLAALAERAAARGAKALVGEYIPTPKNRMVANHFEQLGFSPYSLSNGSGGDGRLWRYEIGRQTPSHHIKCKMSVALGKPLATAQTEPLV
jgi:FkbH-like protein